MCQLQCSSTELSIYNGAKMGLRFPFKGQLKRQDKTITLICQKKGYSQRNFVLDTKFGAGYQILVAGYPFFGDLDTTLHRGLHFGMLITLGCRIPHQRAAPRWHLETPAILKDAPFGCHIPPLEFQIHIVLSNTLVRCRMYHISCWCVRYIPRQGAG